MVWKYAGVVVYLGILLVIGVIASRRMKDLRDYVVGGKRLGFLAVAFSARATGESAWLLLGLTGMGAAVGVRAFWVVAGEILGVMGAWLLLSRRFKRLTDRYDSITIPDYLESRFRDSTHALRMVAAFTLVVFVTIYVSAQIDATGQAAEKFLGFNYHLGAIIGFAVVILYTMSGGFLAVVWSDVFQGLMMVGGLVALPIAGIIAAGGFGPVFDGLRAQDPMLLTAFGEQGATAIGIAGTLALLLIGIGFLGSPQIFARFLALRSEKEISKGAGVAFIWTMAADCGAVMIGILARHLIGVDGEAALPDLAAHLFPAVIVGLYVAIVLSAIMSTADSLLVLASSAAVRDWYQRVRHPEMSDAALVQKSRIATLLLALVALGISLAVAAISESRTVFWFVIFGWSGIAATFCPTMILSLFWSGMTRRGALCAMIAGFAGVPIFKFLAPELPGQVGAFFKALEELTPSFALSFVVGVVVSLTDRKGRERLAGVDDELREAAGRSV